MPLHNGKPPAANGTGASERASSSQATALSDTPNLRIACVGGGLAGLAFALAAARKGISVDVYERNVAIGEIGAGLSMQVNASTMVNIPLGLEREYQNIANDMQPGGAFIQYRSYADGRELATLPVPKDIRPEDLPRYVVRSELLDLFKAGLDPERIHCSKRLTQISRPNSEQNAYTLHFTDGTSAIADVVVGADGIHSFCRGKLQDWIGMEPDKAVFSGKAVYRGLLSRDEVPESAWSAMMKTDASANSYRGPRRHIMTYPIGRTTDSEPGKFLNLVAYAPDPHFDGSDSWTAQGPCEEFAKEFESFCAPVKDCIAALQRHHGPTCWKQMLHYRSAIPKWTDGSGLIIIGDAAHAIPPHLGQGTAMALEDAVALAILLQGATSGNVCARLEAAAALRQPRTTALLEASIHMGTVVDAKEADSLPPSDESRMKSRQWIWEYRADLEAERVFSELQSTTR